MAPRILTGHSVCCAEPDKRQSWLASTMQKRLPRCRPTPRSQGRWGSPRAASGTEPYKPVDLRRLLSAVVDHEIEMDPRMLLDWSERPMHRDARSDAVGRDEDREVVVGTWGTSWPRSRIRWPRRWRRDRHRRHPRRSSRDATRHKSRVPICRDALPDRGEVPAQISATVPAIPDAGNGFWPLSLSATVETPAAHAAPDV